MLNWIAAALDQRVELRFVPVSQGKRLKTAYLASYMSASAAITIRWNKGGILVFFCQTIGRR